MNFVFLAAGKSKRIFKKIKKNKCLIEINNQTLIMTYFNRGTSYNRLEEYEKGINDYSKAIELNPDFVETYYYRGNAYIKLREYAKALVDYNAAIAINPNYQNAINNRKILLESGVLIKD